MEKYTDTEVIWLVQMMIYNFMTMCGVMYIELF